MTTTYPRSNYYDFYIRMPTSSAKGYTLTGATYYVPFSTNVGIFPTEVISDFGTLDVTDKNLPSLGLLANGTYTANMRNGAVGIHYWMSYTGNAIVQRIISLKEASGIIALRTKRDGTSGNYNLIYTNISDGYPYLDVKGYNTYTQKALVSNGSTLTASWTNGGGLVSGDKHRVYYANGLGLTASQVVAANTFVETTSFDASSKDITGLANGDYSVVIVDCQNVSGTFYEGARSSVQSLTVGGTGGTGSPISLAGSASVKATMSGNEKVLRSLAGSASVKATMSGNEKVLRSLVGSMSASLQASGTLGVSTYHEVPLAGSTSVQLTTSGDDKVLRSLAGSASVQLITSGDDKVLRGLAGSASVQLIISGDDKVLRSLTGNTALTVTISPMELIRDMLFTGMLSFKVTSFGSIQTDTANVVEVIELIGRWHQTIVQRGAKQLTVNQEGAWRQMINQRGEKQLTVSQEGAWRQEIKQKGMI